MFYSPYLVQLFRLNRSNALLCLQGAELATDCKQAQGALAPQGSVEDYNSH